MCVSKHARARARTHTHTHTPVTLQDRKRSLGGKNDHNAFWYYRNSHNAKCHVMAVLKQPQCIVALEKQSQREISCK